MPKSNFSLKIVKKVGETMKAEGRILITVSLDLLVFGQIGASIVNFWSSYMQFDTENFQDFVWFKVVNIPLMGPV